MDGQIINEQYLYDIANAIRSKNGESTLYRPQDMDDAILNIQSLLNTSLIDKTIEVYNNNIITSIGNSAFHHCTSLTSVNLPNVSSIGEAAFTNCTSLTSIDFPNLTIVELGVFTDCTSLTSVNLPNVTSIGDYAFYGCTSLTSINLPNVTSIGEYAFSNCSSLTSVTLPGSTVCTGGLNMFFYSAISSTGYIYVPANLVNTYKTTEYWREYASRIVTIN